MASADAIDAITEVLRSNGVAGVAAEPTIAVNPDEGYEYTASEFKVYAYLPVRPGVEDRRLKIEQDLWHLARSTFRRCRKWRSV